MKKMMTFLKKAKVKAYKEYNDKNGGANRKVND